MVLFLILFLAYIVTVILSYRSVKREYNECNKELKTEAKMDFMDYFIILFPVINLVPYLLFLYESKKEE